MATGGGHPDWPQMLIRALILRLVAYSENVGPHGRAHPGEADRYARAAEVVARRSAAFQDAADGKPASFRRW
ncbi:hypothetical protein GTW64_14600 [Streptomyces sp. SID4923]|nr:hypothetical protein [Streptomyces sp. SID4923]